MQTGRPRSGLLIEEGCSELGEPLVDGFLIFEILTGDADGGVEYLLGFDEQVPLSEAVFAEAFGCTDTGCSGCVGRFAFGDGDERGKRDFKSISAHGSRVGVHDLFSPESRVGFLVDGVVGGLFLWHMRLCSA